MSNTSSTVNNSSGTAQFRKDIDGIGGSLSSIKEEAVAVASGVGQAVRSGTTAAKETVVEAAEKVRDRGVAAVTCATTSIEDKIRSNPWTTVAIATGAGLALGILFSRHRN
jgi:ElaB/YqjD/DUF883 family membrane-anchored ribosome-binding protein